MDDLFDKVRMSTLDSINNDTEDQFKNKKIEFSFDSSSSDVPAYNDSDNEDLLKKTIDFPTESIVNNLKSPPTATSTPTPSIESASGKQLRVRLKRNRRIETVKSTKTSQSPDNGMLNANKSKSFNKKTFNMNLTPTKAQQKLFEPNLLEKFKNVDAFTTKRCAVRIQKINLTKLLKQPQPPSRASRHSKENHSSEAPTLRKRKHTYLDKSITKRGRLTNNEKKPKDDVKLKTRNTDKIDAKSKNTTKSQLRTKNRKRGNSRQKKVEKFKTTEENHDSVTSLTDSNRRHFFRAFVKIKRCKYVESNKTQDKLNKSKNLSVSFCDEIEIFGRTLNTDDENMDENPASGDNADIGDIVVSSESGTNKSNKNHEKGAVQAIAAKSSTIAMPVPLDQLKNEPSTDESGDDINRHSHLSKPASPPLVTEKLNGSPSTGTDSDDLDKVWNEKSNESKVRSIFQNDEPLEERLQRAKRSVEEIRKVNVRTIDYYDEGDALDCVTVNQTDDKPCEEPVGKSLDESRDESIDDPVEKEIRKIIGTDTDATEEEITNSAQPYTLNSLNTISDNLNIDDNIENNGCIETNSLPSNNEIEMREIEKPMDSIIGTNSNSPNIVESPNDTLSSIIAMDKLPSANNVIISSSNTKSPTDTINTIDEEMDLHSNGDAKLIAATTVNEIYVSKILSDTSDSFKSTLGAIEAIEATINSNSSSNHTFLEDIIASTGQLENIEKTTIASASPLTSATANNFNEFSLDGSESNQFANADANIIFDDNISKSTNFLDKDDLKGNYTDLPLKLIAEDSGDGESIEHLDDI